MVGGGGEEKTKMASLGLISISLLLRSQRKADNELEDDEIIYF